jgi:branched-subunit amino acid aminotransferase/4-amino-4-deoxychorismate lyase
MSAFATICIHRGRLIFLAEHLEKLRVTCARLGLRQPPQDLFPFEFHCNDGTARLYITAGDGNFHAPLNNGRIFLLIEPETAPVTRPENLILSDSTHTPVFSGLKTGNYWPQVDAHRTARSRNADEIVLVNATRHVISASFANLFATIDGMLMTPRVSSGARAGVMRDWVLARESVIVSDFHPEQLRDASEIFLTNSRYGIAPIERLDVRPLPGRAVGESLQRQYIDSLLSS